MPLNVVYLDDEPDLCSNFSDFFASRDVLIKTFTDPEEAIRYVNRHPPDLLFVDYRLPSTTGDEIALALDPAIPKYLVTGDITIVTTYQFMGVFSKPYPPDEIQAVFDRFLAEAAA